MAIPPDQIYELEKALWTEADFERMGWHDVHIHAIAFRPNTYELLMDIDYIFAWIDPEKTEKYYSFWISPCTLVFSNVHDFKAGIERGLGLEISDVQREEVGRPRNADLVDKDMEWRWTFACQEGDLSFVSTGYQQFTRKKPARAKTQSFDWEKRGGVSFDRISIGRNSAELGTRKSLPKAD